MGTRTCHIPYGGLAKRLDSAKQVLEDFVEVGRAKTNDGRSYCTNPALCLILGEAQEQMVGNVNS